VGVGEGVCMRVTSYLELGSRFCSLLNLAHLRFTVHLLVNMCFSHCS